ncbi:hypothetical protein BMS3Abin03_02108 [bacterium BMS3Abin03]|nr:hypothetical protein BMS3Abin03_02108 [bacterium BMS3Abin03]
MRNKCKMNRFKNIPYLILVLILCFSESLLSQEKPISIYGYLDLAGRDVSKKQFFNGATENPPSTFMLLRTHILLNSHFYKNWKAFAIIRFQNGTFLGNESVENKGAFDLLEGWFEYRYDKWLRIRGGKFLAPFGYYNTRKYNSPIFNSILLPLMYEDEFLSQTSAGTIIPPEQNLGILGEFLIDNWAIGYNAYIGNGSDTDEHNYDVNNNKGIGFRIQVEPPVHNLTIGTSFYTEKSRFDIRPYLDMNAMMKKAAVTGQPVNTIIPILPNVNENETRKTFGFDLRYLIGNFKLRGEYVQSDITDVALIDASNISDTLNTYAFDGSDFSKTFYFINLSYTFFDKLTPFFELNVFEDPRHFVYRNTLHRYTLGTSFRPNSNIAIKIEYHIHQFGDIYNKVPNNFKNYEMLWAAISVFFN